ncbi:MAG: hypothetical protein IT430_04525 [Phycisphaerales bacterium]|nr:hypothetical protein [Phycisphaerales bacterium]
MGSTVLTIADAVVASLNGASFSMPFTAQRLLVPSLGLEDLANLHVTVVPRTVTRTASGRRDSWLDCTIDVGVQKKVASDPDADALIALVEEITEHLSHQRLAGAPEAAWMGTTTDPLISPEHLDQQRAFTSVVSVTYRVRT